MIADENYYKGLSSGAINCKDGSKKFTKAQLNDDFCDCPDGSDEPGLCVFSLLFSSFFLLDCVLQNYAFMVHFWEVEVRFACTFPSLDLRLY